MERVRWGIIGCGEVTEVKSGPGFQKASGSELVAVMRRNAGLAEDYARRHQVSTWYSEAEKLIADPNVDAIYVATPPGSHKEYTELAAKAGKPVYVEKPMARTYEECQDMIEVCEGAGVPLFVAYYRRAQPRFLKVKELLEGGAVGRVCAVATTHWKKPVQLSDTEPLPWRYQKELAGGGLFFDVGSHTLDLLDFLLGPIAQVQGHASNQAGPGDVEDTVSAAYRFESGVHGTGLWCFSADRNEDRNVIIGDRGRLIFSTFDNVPIRLETADGVQEWSIEQPQHVQQPMIQRIVDELLGKTGAQAPSTGRTAARTARVMDEIVKSYYGGGE
ncbi:Gfo/Idh/MocA family protein [Paenibacillus turpanensis]|uniref:Gfo/Idh/MocA family protein n=1 Tax=Paenibacillus turpanensis TaxID=2689078 RepID=UPI00140B5973